MGLIVAFLWLKIVGGRIILSVTTYRTDQNWDRGAFRYVLSKCKKKRKLKNQSFMVFYHKCIHFTRLRKLRKGKKVRER